MRQEGGCRFPYLLLCIATSLGLAAQPPPGCVVTRVAGAEWFDNGDFGPAPEAIIQRAKALAPDRNGNLFLLEGNTVRKVTAAGTMMTVAGTDSVGFQGDGGTALVAQFYEPSALAVDRDGNVFIADTYNARIRKLAVDGTISTFAGMGYVTLAGTAPVPLGDGGPATAALVDFPLGVAVDDSGNVFIAERVRIRRVGVDGIVTTVRQMYPSPPGTTATLRGLAADRRGNLYFGDVPQDALQKLTPDGMLETLLLNGRPVSAQAPFAVDEDGNVYVGLSTQVWLIRPSGESVPIAGLSPGAALGNGGPALQAQIRPGALAVDSQRRVYIFDTWAGSVRVVGPDGVMAAIAGRERYRDGADAQKVGLEAAGGVAVDREGRVYVADTARHQVRAVDPDGSVRTVAGTGYAGFNGDGLPATEAQLSSPAGLALDAAGNLHIADRGNNRVRRISSDGIIQTIAGEGGYAFGGDGGSGTEAQLAFPGGLAFDVEGNLYIGDTDNHRVRKLTPDGVIHTVAGTGAIASDGDGGPATEASIGGPEGVAVDRAGNIYVADRFFYRVRKISTDGGITTVVGPARSVTPMEGPFPPNVPFLVPYALALADDGSLFIADNLDRKIYQRPVEGGTERFTCGGVSQFDVRGIAFGDGGDLYISGGGTVTRAGRPRRPSPFQFTVWNAAATFRAGGPVAPGEMVNIVARNPSGVSALSGPDSSSPVYPERVRVFFDDLPAPIIDPRSPGYRWSQGIVAVVPSSVAGKAYTRVRVEAWGQRSVVLTLPVVDAYPVIFEGEMRGRRGEVVTFRATGGGEMNPPASDGAIAVPPLRQLRLPVSMTIGGNPAEVLWAGEAPDMVGVVQINVRVPTAEPVRRWYQDLLPVVLKIGPSAVEWWRRFHLLP